jgi:cobyrinic acid a,c-diamide synthase
MASLNTGFGAVFDKELVLGGVLFNRIGGESHRHWLQEAVESSGLMVEVLGGIPKVHHPLLLANLPMSV